MSIGLPFGAKLPLSMIGPTIAQLMRRICKYSDVMYPYAFIDRTDYNQLLTTYPDFVLEASVSETIPVDFSV